MSILVKSDHRGKISNLSNWKEEAWKISGIRTQYNMNFIYISLHGKIWTQQIDLAPNVWLHSSVGRASHRYHGGHGFESRWSPDIFQASAFQLRKLEHLQRWSLFTFTYNRRTIWISYIFHNGYTVLQFMAMHHNGNDKHTIFMVLLANFSVYNLFWNLLRAVSRQQFLD